MENTHELLGRYGLEFFHIDFEIGNPKAKIKGIQKKQATIDRFFWATAKRGICQLAMP